VIGELSGRVTMLDPSTLTPVGRPVRLKESVRSVAAGPDNRTAIALTGFDDASGFWVGSSPRWVLIDLEAGVVLDQGSLGFNGFVVDFSADGRRAAVGGFKGELAVLNLDTGEPVRPPRRIHDLVTAVTYSADGTQLLTSGADGSDGLWNGQTGELLARVATPQRFTEAGFGSDPNSVLIAPLWGGPVYEWDTRIEHAIQYACRMAGREFTESEWTEEFGDRPYRKACPDD